MLFEHKESEENTLSHSMQELSMILRKKKKSGVSVDGYYLIKHQASFLADLRWAKPKVHASEDRSLSQERKNYGTYSEPFDLCSGFR